VCVDVANGYSEPFLDFIKQLRADNPTITIMAGNVVTGEMTEALILAGADIVKVGIGPGSVCTTRLIAGVGYPQLSAIIECADAAHGLGGLICGDGGCTTPGDVAKAFGAGADFVMLGGMLAGHDECGGEVDGASVRFVGNYTAKPSDQSGWTHIVTNPHTGKEVAVPKELLERLQKVSEMTDPLFHQFENLFKVVLPDNPKMKFYGMSSKAAMDKHSGGVAEYRASEGKEVWIPYRGAVEGTVQQILGGVRSACTYTGAKTLKELSKRTTFVRVTQTHNTTFGDSSK
jgi:GMP reductase